MSDHDSGYAGKLVELLRRSGSRQRLFVDVGAHRGDFTRMLQNAFPNTASHHLIEADPELCAGLRRQFADTRDAQVWNFALHNSSGVIDFHVHADRGTSSVLQRPQHGRRYFHSSDRVVETQRVPSISLDAFLVQQRIEHVDLLKVDTQGAEAAIFRGAERSLAQACIDIIYTEFFVVPHYDGAALLHELWRQLAQHGYVLFDLFKGPHASNGQLRFGDAIFVSPQFNARYLGSPASEA